MCCIASAPATIHVHILYFFPVQIIIFAIMDRVIFDDSGILVSYIGLEANEDVLNVQLYIENNTRRTVSIDVNEVSVNDYIIESQFFLQYRRKEKG